MDTGCRGQPLPEPGMDIGCRGQPLPEPDLLSQVQGLAPASIESPPTPPYDSARALLTATVKAVLFTLTNYLHLRDYKRVVIQR